MSAEMQPGEIERTLARIEADLRDFRIEERQGRHKLADDVNLKLGKLAETAATQKAKIEGLEAGARATETALDEMERDVKAVTAKANVIGGAWSAATVAIGLFIAWVKGK